jgi:hypothetical protein
MEQASSRKKRHVGRSYILSRSTQYLPHLQLLYYFNPMPELTKVASSHQVLSRAIVVSFGYYIASLLPVAPH